MYIIHYKTTYWLIQIRRHENCAENKPYWMKLNIWKSFSNIEFKYILQIFQAMYNYWIIILPDNVKLCHSVTGKGWMLHLIVLSVPGCQIVYTCSCPWLPSRLFWINQHLTLELSELTNQNAEWWCNVWLCVLLNLFP